MTKLAQKIDLLVLIPALLLSLIGLLMIYSLSYEANPSFFIRQTAYILVSVALFITVSNLNFRDLIHLAPFLYVLLIGLLVATFVFGSPVRGSLRWLDFGFVTIQGSEFAKPTLVLILAYLLNKYPPKNFKNLLLSAAVTFLPTVLIARQPDFSNAFLLSLLWGFLIFISGVNLTYFGLLITVGLSSVPVIWSFVLRDYQRARLLTFFNPNVDAQGASYNILQALIAIGSGELVGRGLGQGTQSHLAFLPEARTDFIFAAAGEELGFVGLFLVMMIFTFLIFRIFQLAAKMKTSECTIFAYGSGFLIAIQFFINAAMNSGLFPVSGVTLPFVSFGGSSVLSLFLLLALLTAAKNEKNS